MAFSDGKTPRVRGTRRRGPAEDLHTPHRTTLLAKGVFFYRSWTTLVGDVMRVSAGVVVAFVVVGCSGPSGTDEVVRLRKLAPASVSDPAAWSLFDRSVSSGYVPDGRPVVVRLDRTTPVWVLKTFDAADYTLSVRTRDGGSVGIPAIDLSGHGRGWHRVESDALIATNELVFRFSALGEPGPIPEIELWEPVDADGADDASAETADGVAGADGRIAFTADSTAAVLAPGACSVFDVAVTRAPALFRRAYVTYEATGVLRAFSLARTVNGLSRQGGEYWLAGDGTAGPFIDEIDPSLLVLGRNEVQLCAPGDATREVTVSNLRVSGELDRGTGLGIAATVPDGRDVSALVDGDTATSAHIAAGERVVVSLSRAIAPDAILLPAGEVLDVECASDDGSAARFLGCLR